MAKSSPTAQLEKVLSTVQGKTYTVAAVTIILVLVIFVFGVFPAISSILSQIQQNAKRTEALTQIGLKSQTLTNLTTEEKNKRPVSLALNSALPDKLGQVDLLEDVAEIAAKTNNTLISYTQDKIEESLLVDDMFLVFEPLVADKALMVVRGQRADLENFLLEIEQNRRIFNVREVVILKDTEFDGFFRMSVRADVYYWIVAVE